MGQICYTSLKLTSREKRGHGGRVRVTRKAKVPKKWPEFLRDSKNKEELFKFLREAIQMGQWPENKVVYVTTSDNVAAHGTVMDELCSHEEADMHVVYHSRHALQQGMKTVVVRTVDTYVVVIFAGLFFCLKVTVSIFQLWVAIGRGEGFRNIHVNTVCDSLGKRSAKGILMFHAMTGCDVVSAFHGMGKRSAWKAWSEVPGMTEAFATIVRPPFAKLDVASPELKLMEKFFNTMYDKSSVATSVNEAR